MGSEMCIRDSSITISLARSRTYSSVPIGTLPTVTRPLGNTDIDDFEERNLLHRPGVAFWWKIHGLGGVDHDVDVLELSSEEGKGINRVGRDSHKAKRDIVQVNEGFHSFSLEFLPETP